jgi:hypothetical protein
MHTVDHSAETTLRWLTRRRGIVAVEVKMAWMATKATRRTPARVRSAMMRPSFHCQDGQN